MHRGSGLDFGAGDAMYCGSSLDSETKNAMHCASGLDGGPDDATHCVLCFEGGAPYFSAFSLAPWRLGGSNQTLIAPLRKSLLAIFTLTQAGLPLAKASSRAGPSWSSVST